MRVVLYSCFSVSTLKYISRLINMCFTDPEPVRPGQFSLCRGWSWVGNATSPALSRATVLTSCSTPNPSMEERSTGSLLRSCKKKTVIQYNLLNHSSKADFWIKDSDLLSDMILFYFRFSPPNDKKSFCSIEGEWNGVMYAKWATGVSFLLSFSAF